MAADPCDVDAVIVGGGHNGLVAAAYLARAGLRVRLLERLQQVGGAAVSSQIFDGVDARLSRYAYLVSLLPARILDDLGATVRLAPRPYSSYTPDPATAGRTGLLVGPQWGHHPLAGDTFGAIGAHDDERAFAAFYRRCRLVTERLWPTLLEPLPTREQARAAVGEGDPAAAAAWRAMVERPIGRAIVDALGNDLVRGVVATDALIGTFAALDDPSLQQNVCFLYHLLGGGVGEWHVPVGGMGAVSAALAAAASGHGAEIITAAEVYTVDPNGEVRYRRHDDEHVVRGRFV
jgi:phytoene dehydrogenase-like protein